MSKQSQDDKVQALLNLGSELTGAAAGGAIGFILGGPLGAAGGRAAGVLIAKGTQKLLAEFGERSLSQRERVRIGAAATYALERIQERLERGDELRNDGFFDKAGSERSKSDELLEGVLQKSKNEYEEKKIKLLGSFYGNLAFASGVSVEEANFLIRIAEGLTYRQLCILAILHLVGTPAEIALSPVEFRKSVSRNKYTSVALFQEILDLNRKGLVLCKASGGERFRVLNGIGDIVPKNLHLMPLGQHLAALVDSLDVFLASDDSEGQVINPDIVGVLELLREENASEAQPESIPQN